MPMSAEPFGMKSGSEVTQPGKQEATDEKYG